MPDDLVAAVLGTGTMGAAMAANIAKAGLGLRVWNREPGLAAPLGELGAVIGATPAQACHGADVILTLTILAAASHAQARDRVQPVLDAVGSRTVWLDDVGQPSSLKLAYNAWVLTTVKGLAESLTLAEALGVDPKLVADVIRGSALDSGYIQNKAPKMISDHLDAPSFPLVAAAKDAVLITDAARAASLRLGIAETVRERLQLAVESGFGRADVAATYRVSRRDATT